MRRLLLLLCLCGGLAAQDSRLIVLMSGDNTLNGLPSKGLAGVWSGTSWANNSTFTWRKLPVSLVTYTRELDNGKWTKTNSSIAANSTTGPDGTTTADTVTASAANGEVYQSWADIDTYNYTVLALLKAGTADDPQIRWVDQGSTSHSVECNLTSVTATQVSGSTDARSIVSLGGDWFACAFTAYSRGTDSNDALAVRVPTDTETVYVAGLTVIPGTYTASQAYAILEQVGAGQVLSNFAAAPPGTTDALTLGATAAPNTDDPARTIDATAEKIQGYTFDGSDDYVTGLPSLGATWTSINCNATQCEAVDSTGGKYINGGTNASAVVYDIGTGGAYSGLLSVRVDYTRVLTSGEQLRVCNVLSGALSGRGISISCSGGPAPGVFAAAFVEAFS